MKKILLTILTALSSYNTIAMEIKESKLEPQELASFHKILNKSFDVKNIPKNDELKCWVSLYVDGQEYSKSVVFSFDNSRHQLSEKPQKFSVMHQDQGEIFKVIVSHNNTSNSYDVMKPKGIKISGYTHGVKFDSKGRLVLGYDISPNKKGEIIISQESTKPEKAKTALVFNLLQTRNSE